MSNAKKRFNRVERRQQMLDKGIELSRLYGYHKVTRDHIAGELGVSSTLIAAYFPRMGLLRDAILQEAIKQEAIDVILQGYSMRESVTQQLTASIKKQIVSYICEN